MTDDQPTGEEVYRAIFGETVIEREARRSMGRERGPGEEQAYANGVADERNRLSGRLLNLKIDLQTGKTKQHAVKVIEEILRGN